MKNLTKTEMTKILGGDANLPMKSDYKTKSKCTSEAYHLIDIHVVKDMSAEDIAKEIFAHAVAYYRADELRNLPLGEGVADYLIAHASEIYIADGGDTLIRKAAYTLVWSTFNDF